jgi:methionyl-tRNA formyltransferase
MAGRLRTVFFGSSTFSVPSLQRLLAEQDVVAVCSQPDRPAGRGLELAPTAVSIVARKAGVAVLTPVKLDEAFISHIRAYKPDLLAVASYGKILPAKLLAIQAAAALNVHPSLLPAYRGATPIQAALRDGCDKTGVTIFWMSAGLDDGDIALARNVHIEPNDNYGSLHDKLALVGAELLSEAARLLGEKHLGRKPQRNEDATYTKPLTKADLRLRFDVPATDVVNQVRSLSPKPSAWMPFDGKRLKILEAAIVPGDVVARVYSRQTYRPGDIIAFEKDGPVVATAAGAICVTKVIPEGKPIMSGADFARRTTQTR